MCIQEVHHLPRRHHLSDMVMVLWKGCVVSDWMVNERSATHGQLKSWVLLPAGAACADVQRHRRKALAGLQDLPTVHQARRRLLCHCSCATPLLTGVLQSLASGAQCEWSSGSAPCCVVNKSPGSLLMPPVHIFMMYP
jgi:hypothetical protein